MALFVADAALVYAKKKDYNKIKTPGGKNMGREVEIKLRAADTQQLEKVFAALKACAFAAEEKEIAMHTRYFDTPESVLRGRKWTLRIRWENDMDVLTFKTKGENHCRGEWNLQRSAAGFSPTKEELRALVEAGAPELLLELTALQVTCEAEFIRRAAMLTLEEGTKIELAADVGRLRGKQEQEDFCELELELYSGSYEKMAELAKNTGLTEEPMSKAARAMRLR